MAENLVHNMAVMRHWFNTVNENDLTKMVKELGEIITEDYLLHDPSTPGLPSGRADYLKVFEQQMAATADRKATIEDLFAVDDKVITRGIYECLDLTTQERIRVAVMVISRFKGGKIKEEWQIVSPISSPTW